jgi:MFS family permease
LYNSVRTPTEWDAATGPVAPDATAPRPRRTVGLLGLTSLFTDVSSEMVASTLPLYLTVVLRFTPLQFGLVDGIYQGVTALVRLAGGVVADRGQRHKQVAVAGYATSAVCKLALLLAGGFSAIAAVIAVDRTGKGIRTAPRDAMLSMSAAPGRLATAFGLHRAMDTTGALLGPVVAFAILSASPTAYPTVFVVSFFVAVLGLSVLVFLVRPDRPLPRSERSPAGAPPAGLRPVLRLLVDPRLRRLVVVASILAVTTVSDAFVYLVLQRQINLPVGLFPALFVGTSAVYLVSAVPVGRLADRVGRTRVFLSGYVLLLALYVVLGVARPGLAQVLTCLALLGLFYAATDGILAAMVSAVVPPEVRSTGLALVTTATAVGRLVASAAFGLLWTRTGQDAALAWFALGLAGAIAVGVRTLRSAEDEDA